MISFCFTFLIHFHYTSLSPKRRQPACGILVPVGIPTQAEIEEFLKEFKRCWDGKVIDRVNRKNDDTLAELGFLPQHRTYEIHRLVHTDFYRGPSPDHDIAGHEWWEFGRKVKGREIYIKIKVYVTEDGEKGGRCMSFHFPEKKITYPYKKKGRGRV